MHSFDFKALHLDALQLAAQTAHQDLQPCLVGAGCAGLTAHGVQQARVTRVARCLRQYFQNLRLVGGQAENVGVGGDQMQAGQLREDAHFEFDRASRSNEPAKRMSVEEMRQFYEKFDNKGAEAP